MRWPRTIRPSAYARKSASDPAPVNAQSVSPGTIGAALADATTEFERCGVPEARANAELLLAHLLDADRGWLWVHRRDPLAHAVATHYADWVRRRAAREPLQHLTGVQEFYGRSFVADARALVPRPETEGLIDAVLSLALPRDARVAELGVGGGCIAVTLAVERPHFTIDALDLSQSALDLARENAQRFGVSSRIRLMPGDLAVPPAEWREAMHVVVSNPPYGRESEWPTLEPEVREHDPREAFVAGPSGLEAYRALASPAHDLLLAGGYLVLELGAGQANDVRGIVAGAGFSLREVRPDLNGIDRVLVACKDVA